MRCAVRYYYSGIVLHHVFKRDAQGRVEPDIESQIGAAADKARFIIERFFRVVKNKRVLFVRNGLYGDSLRPDGEEAMPDAEEQAARATRLHTLLRTCLSPRHVTSWC